MPEDTDMSTCNTYMFGRVPSKLQMILLTRGLCSKGGQGSTCASRRHGTWVFSKLVTVLSSLFPIQFPQTVCCELWIERSLTTHITIIDQQREQVIDKKEWYEWAHQISHSCSTLKFFVGSTLCAPMCCEWRQLHWCPLFNCHNR